MTITVEFTNGSDSYTLEDVRDVIWSNAYNTDLVVADNRRGFQKKTITINGFVIVHDPSQNTAKQQEIETNLRNVGGGTLKYTGIDDISDVRFVSLDFEAYRGNPVCVYTVKFETDSQNPHAYHTVKIGSISLSPQPAVVDTLRQQADGTQISSSKSRQFKIDGHFEGDLDTVNQAQIDLIAEVEAKDSIVIELTAGSHTGLFTVRTHDLEFSSPEIYGSGYARKYSYSCSTYDDYTIEPYSLGESSITFGNITLDILNSFSHTTNFQRMLSGEAYYITDESLSVSGKKYFANYTEYETFRQTLDSITGGVSKSTRSSHRYTSVSGSILELTSGNLSSFARDGYYPGTNAKRYSASVSLSWTWVKDQDDITFGENVIYFGLTWHDVQSLNYSATVNSNGHVTSKSVSITGRLNSTQYANAKSKLGTKVDFDSNFKNLYITSVSPSTVETLQTESGELKLYSVSISANQLDSSSQYSYFLNGIFNVRKDDAGNEYTGSPISFDNITSRSKSVSNRYDTDTSAYIVTSINYSISGEIFQEDLGNGQPPDPNELNQLLFAIDAQQTHGISDRTDDPSNYKYFLNSFSVGGWELFTHPTTGNKTWKQSVSISCSVAFEVGAQGFGGKDYVDTRSEIWNKETPKYTSFQVLSYGTVFKKIGINPASVTVTIQRQFSNKSRYDPNSFPSLSLDPPVEFTTKYGSDYVVVKDTQESRGLTNRKVKTYQAIKSENE